MIAMDADAFANKVFVHEQSFDDSARPPSCLGQ